ncbi:hypothetical protein ACFLRT_02070 [Acidobacteriota bacterium]
MNAWLHGSMGLKFSHLHLLPAKKNLKKNQNPLFFFYFSIIIYGVPIWRYFYVCLCVDNNCDEYCNHGVEIQLIQIEQTTGLFKPASTKHPKKQEVLTWQKNSAAF